MNKPIIYKLILIQGLLLALAVILSFPVKSFGQLPGDNPDQKGFYGFSGTETSPQGYRFAWALQNAKLQYIALPRYTPLSLHLRLNLLRAPDLPPAKIEIYENTYDPPGTPRLVATLDGSQARTGLQDYYLTLPTRTSGRGVVIEFKSNTFSVSGDPRQLGFVFGEAELQVPRTSFIHLLWPNPYWVGGFMLLTGIAAWALLAGLSFLETLLLAGMLDFLLVAVSASTYQSSWWLVIIALSFLIVTGWNYRLVQRDGRWSFWPLILATALILIFFLFSHDEFLTDINFYWRWSIAIQKYGIWDAYAHIPDLDNLPLIIFFLTVGNLFFVPLGLDAKYGTPDSYVAWRVVVSLLYIGAIAVYYLISHVRKVKPDLGGSTKFLVLVAFNAALFINPAIWGQSDMIAILPLLLTFYLIYRRNVWAGGLALSLVIISKPQAWFVAPALLLLFIQRLGWKKGSIGLGIAALAALVLGGIGFGFSPNSVTTYLQKPEFAGENDEIKFSRYAFNFSRLINGVTVQNVPGWLVVGGILIAGSTILAVLIYGWRNKLSLERYATGAALMGIGCFVWLIKMKERYLFFGLIFLGVAALKERRLLKVFLVASWIQMLQLLGGLFNYIRKDSPSLWAALIFSESLAIVLSVLNLMIYGYLAYFFFWKMGKTEKALENI